jgi:hypothetical protein
MKALDVQLKALPRLFLEKLIARKLKAAGVEKHIEEAAKTLADNAMAGRNERVSFGDDSEQLEITIEITPADVAEVEAKALEFIEKQFPEIVDKTSLKSAARLAKQLKRNWPGQAEYQAALIAGFVYNLDQRWGRAIDYLRMLLKISRERQEENLQRLGRLKSVPNPARTDVLVRLHARGCQVAEEIIVLLENGFADGAMARWRTLHEIETVFSVINSGDEDLAVRYIDHQIIEDMNGLDEHTRRLVPLGEPDIDPAEKAAILCEYNRVVTKYGKPFASPCGWAAKLLNKAKVLFGDLEEAAKHVRARPYYRMASHNVHANASGTFTRLGALDDRVFTAGRSNAGLGDPGVKTAHSLVLLTIALFGPSFEIMDIVALRAVGILGDEAVEAFKKAHKILLRDDAKHRRVIAKAKAKKKKAKKKPKKLSR